MNTSRYAKDYANKGLSVVPILANQKKPVMRDWQALRIRPEDIPQYFNGKPQNVGILLGEPSGGLVDVDLDVEEAVKVAEHFLPPTLNSGRVKTPRTHWWFRAPGAETEKWKDTDGRMLVELRSTGCQTVVEPSVHPEGDRYLWHRGSGSSIADTSAEDLSRACQELATAVLIARHLPPVGGRHDYAMALAGYLLRPGRLDEKTVLKIMLAAWHAGGAASREAVRDLEGIVRDTTHNLEVGREVVGGPTLDEIASGMPDMLTRWWGWERVVSVDSHHESAVESLVRDAPWPYLNKAAYHGLPGEIVKAIEPHTEADPVAVLINLLAALGNAAGRGVHFKVGADTHHLKINAVLVGETSKGRKGTSWAHPKQFMHAVDCEWVENRVLSGLSSGEGLIYAVRDKVMGKNRKGEEIIEDEGVSDKRLLIVEGEFASVLKVMSREGNTLSPVIREAWDDGTLQTLTKNSPQRATEAHVSIIGHVTKPELLRRLNQIETANGFANRFMFVVVKRSKELPFGGEPITASDGLIRRLNDALVFAKSAGEIAWGESAKETWREVYGPLSDGKPGLLGAVIGRAEAQVMRLAALYAAIDTSKTIEKEHLMAALALWDYAEASARYIFGDATGDPIADRIMETLGVNPDGLTRTDIRDLFKNNQTAKRIEQALALLLEAGRAQSTTEETGGRPVEKWFAA
jgi:hypothetical protein